MKNKIENIVKEIASEIIQKQDIELKYLGYGLMSGLTGDAIFLNEISKIDSNYSKWRDQFIETVFDSIAENEAYPYHCAGISGACLGLQFLFKDTINDQSFEFADGEISEYIDNELVKCLDGDNLDFLHGAVGLGFYYIERIKQGDKKYLKNLTSIIQKLKNSAVNDGNGIKWIQKPSEKYANISLSHGMASIIILLSEVLSLDIIIKDEIKSILYKSTKFLLDQQINFSLYGSMFPYASKEAGIKKSRLAWCYGDLGVGIALYKASNTLKDDNLRVKSLKIFDSAMSRRNLEENSVLDASFCHGSAGIAVIFHDIFLKTGDRKYYETSMYWIEKTVELYEQDKIFYSMNNSYINNMSFLEGKVGIALSLLAICYETPSQWKKFFLI